MKENNDGKILSKIQDTHNLIFAKLDNIDKKFGELNGSVAKHNEKLANHDIINAQMTITQQQTVDNLRELSKNVTALTKDTTQIFSEFSRVLAGFNSLSINDKDNTEFRLRADGSISTLKWVMGFLGLSTIAAVIKSFFF